MPFWEDRLPRPLAGKNVIIAAHGNHSVLDCVHRKHFDEDIMNVEMKTGELVVYTFDDKLNVVSKEKLD